MLIRIGRDMVSLVVVLPPLHARAQEEHDKYPHDGILGARGKEVVVPHIVSYQCQLHAL